MIGEYVMAGVGRTILGIVVEIVAWLALATTAFIVLRIAWPAYTAAEPAMQFDLSMMVARLAISSVTLVLAAWLAAFTLRDGRIASLAGGLVLLAAFVPVHIGLWSKFPVWYHLTFLVSLPLLTFIGGRLAGLRTTQS
jgi:hypothetical protein